VDAAAPPPPPPANQAPIARLSASPTSGTAPLAVQLSAAASSDADGHIVSYRFEFGDGTTAGPQTSATASHTYGAGNWTAKVTVTDDGGATAAAFASISVSSPPSNLVGNPSFESGTTGWAAVGGASIRLASGGHTGSFSLLASAPLLSLSAYGITDQPDWVQHTAGVGTRYHVRAWVRTEIGAGLVSLAVRETGTSGSFQYRSSSLLLGTGWAALDLDVTTQMNDSRLDLSIVNAPSVLGTAFRVDDVSIVQGGGEPALMSAADDGAPPPPADDPFLAPGVHPNPMRADGARIVFATAAAGPARIELFDLAGRVVRQLDGDPAAPAGTQSVVFDGRGADGQRLPGGVYYYQVRAAGTLTRGRLVIVQ
jgi:PKD repeat protein